jgi:hypothetical protein
MKTRYWLALVCLGGVAAAPVSNSIFAQIGVQIQGPMKDLDSLNQQDTELKRSEDAQVFSSDAEKKQRARIMDEANQVQMDANEADQMRQRIIDSGCPPEGGEVPVELAQRCNPQIDAHRAKVDEIMQRAKSIKEQLDQVNELQANISATVLANAQKRKEIDAKREEAMAERDRLQALAIEELLKRTKLGAAKACTSECCHRVIYDGADPKLCGIGLICQSFQNAGLFGSNVNICGAGPSSTPIREASTTAVPSTPTVHKTKAEWEAEYQAKMAAYTQELNKQQQAVQQYQSDMAAMEQRRAELKAAAEQAQAAWERAVAACKAGDYSQCGH